MIDNITQVPLTFNGLMHATEALAFLESSSPEIVKQFVRIWECLKTLGIPQTVNQKIVHGYSGQPSGYNNVPMFVFCRITDNGICARGTRMAMIPLDLDLTVIFPVALLSPSISEERIVRGKNEHFMPANLDEFLDNPSVYINLEAVKERLTRQ